MVIEESVVINSGIEEVWKAFTDLTCWDDWNSVLRNVSTVQTEEIAEGKSFKCRIYPFKFPISFQPVIEEVVPHRRIVWSGEKYGIHALHEYIFRQLDNETEVTSRETFTGPTISLFGLFFPARKIRDLTISMLSDLKKAIEK